MGQKLVIGPISKGLRNDVTPFNIDNDSFPVLRNAFQWRGRVKRKRGTELLTRLRRFFNSTNISYNTGTTTITLDGSGAGNILINASWTLQANASIDPGTVILTASGGPTVYTDPTMDGYLTPTGSLGPNTINYATGAILIPAQAGNTVSASFNYFPNLPVMGLRDFITTRSQFPTTIAFDTTYSYNILNADPYSSYDVSFYKNPTTATYPGYVQKTNETPTTWNGQDYQQFYTVNYQGALWATNGIEVPFDPTNVGMQFNTITAVAIDAAGPPAIVTITTTTNHGLVVGDFVFLNEIVGMTGINYQTGYVIAVPAANQIQVELPNATVGGAWASGGIVQYLTNRSDKTKDSLRWYDGDPTNGSVNNPVLNGNQGWVNFAPPLSIAPFSISDLPAAVYYLVGARVILPFKDRLLFFGPVVQTSSANSQRYLKDTVIYSQNGTPYYTASFTDTSLNYPLTPTTPPGYVPILVPNDQTATPSAYFEDVTGFGGFVQVGIDQDIVTVSPNEDVMILGMTRAQVRLVYTGNDVVPFNFFIINSEYGSGSTFSTINMDRGVITTGSRGIIMTSQTNSNRIDLIIPDEIFEFRLTDNGIERVTAIRNFIQEWIYFTYPSDDESETNYRFPTQTLIFNYRDNSWGIFRESYTTYGLFRKQTGFTWQTVGNTYPSWSVWNDPWDAGTSNRLQPLVIGGNQQGFVLVRDVGTGEGNSLYIKGFSGSTVTCPDHCLNDGDFIIITGCLGTIGAQVNGKIFSVNAIDENTFTLNPLIGSGTYFGEGLIKRMYVPLIQTKQFPTAWEMARKTRLGPQQYLLTRTSNGQIQLLIFLSQNEDSAYNTGPIIPSVAPDNSSLIYSTTLYTCPESENLGLTPANININTPTAVQQSQIWHRMNTSLIGDTVQIGFTMSDEQMRAYAFSGTEFAITGATNAYPAVITTTAHFSVGTMVQISGVQGMTQLNNNLNEPNPYYEVMASSPTTVTLNVDSTVFGAYVSGGIVEAIYFPNQFTEIELHNILLDVNPSQLLV